MHPATTPIHHLAQQSRAHAPALLAGAQDPHAELLAMVWGPRFDRERALGLWARLSRQQPSEAVPLLPALLSAADRFDTLGAPVQHRLRRLIVRHHAAAERRGSDSPMGRPEANQPPRGAATRVAAERGGKDSPLGRPEANQPPRGAATRVAAERGGGVQLSE